MAFRRVASAFSDSHGDIVALAHQGEDWSPRTAEDVIADITAGIHHYVVAVPGEPTVDIHVVDGPAGLYLRTNPDADKDNNLDSVPDARAASLPEFLGNHPAAFQTNWSDNLQGVTHSADHWFFTQKTKLLKFEPSSPLPKDSKAAIARADMPPELQALGCDHFGDPDHLQWQGHGYTFVPVEGKGKPAKDAPVPAVFEDLGTEIAFVGWHLLPSQNAARGTSQAGWCAIDPQTLLLHSSHNQIDFQHPVFRYNVDLDGLADGDVRLVASSDLRLRSEKKTVDIPPYLQGGCFSPRGHLFLLSGKADDDETQGGIRVFDRNGVLLCRSSVSDEPFLYEYDSGNLVTGELSEEPEGLTFWDVDALPAGRRPPSFSGQLHALLLNNDVGDDRFYFKHYSVAPGTL